MPNGKWYVEEQPFSTYRTEQNLRTMPSGKGYVEEQPFATYRTEQNLRTMPSGKAAKNKRDDNASGIIENMAQGEKRQKNKRDNDCCPVRTVDACADRTTVGPTSSARYRAFT